MGIRVATITLKRPPNYPFTAGDPFIVMRKEAGQVDSNSLFWSLVKVV
jgi:hypothetical protein